MKTFPWKKHFRDICRKSKLIEKYGLAEPSSRYLQIQQVKYRCIPKLSTKQLEQEQKLILTNKKRYGSQRSTHRHKTG